MDTTKQVYVVISAISCGTVCIKTYAYGVEAFSFEEAKNILKKDLENVDKECHGAFEYEISEDKKQISISNDIEMAASPGEMEISYTNEKGESLNMGKKPTLPIVLQRVVRMENSIFHVVR